jgi:hypothetical protein
MILDITTFTLGHTVISNVAIAAEPVVVGGLIAGVRIDGWTGIFLATTALTSITGFFFPFGRLVASHYVGIISLVILARRRGVAASRRFRPEAVVTARQANGPVVA